MRIIGVDPGLTGGLALSEIGKLLEVDDMPVVNKHVNAWGLASMLRSWMPIDHVFVEFVRSMPGQGVASTFKFGEGYGMLLGVLACLAVPYSEVTPAKWCAYHRVDGKDKEQHRQRALELFPYLADRFALKKHDGRADAALISVYGNASLEVPT